MFKLDLEKAEEPGIKLPPSAGSGSMNETGCFTSQSRTGFCMLSVALIAEKKYC